jgi:hypothetical protein
MGKTPVGVPGTATTMGLDLYSILWDNAVQRNIYDQRIPVACPRCGEPLRQGPPQSPGVWYCLFDFFQYPRDYDPETMSGM